MTGQGKLTLDLITLFCFSKKAFSQTIWLTDTPILALDYAPKVDVIVILYNYQYIVHVDLNWTKSKNFDDTTST